MKLVVKILVGFVVVYLVAVVIFYLIQEQLIFHDEKLPQNFQFDFEQPFDEVFLDTKDHKKIHGLLFKVPNPKGVILYFHGNAGSLRRWGDIASPMRKYGYDIFIIDYRSYGKSTGSFDEELMYDDAEIAYQYVKDKYGEDKICIYGRSLGCTFSIRTAAKHHPKQLILEAPFYNLKDPAKYHYPFLPYDWLMKFRFDSGAYLPKVHCKTTIFHGTNDRVIPISSARKLFGVSNQSQTEMIELDGGTHHNSTTFSIYKERMAQLLD